MNKYLTENAISDQTPQNGEDFAMPANVQVSLFKQISLIFLFTTNCNDKQKVVTNEKNSFEVKKSRVELQSLPIRAYLDQTVVPVLMQAMSAVAKER